MPAPVSSYQNHVTTVGEGTIPGNSLLFCNGISNPTIEDAKNCAAIVSKAFCDMEVKVLHNTTRLEHIFEISWESVESQMKLTNLFVKMIKNEIQNHRSRGLPDREITIHVFLHSHGARVFKSALPKLSAVERRMLSIHSLGGAQLIKNGSVGFAENIVHNEDEIATFGNILTNRGRESGLLLSDIKKIEKFRKENNYTLIQAIFYKSVEETDMYFRMKYIDLNAKEVVKKLYFKNRIEEYKKLYREYNVTILDGKPFQSPEFTKFNKVDTFGDVLLNIGTALGNTARGVVALGQNSLENHEFSSYANAVDEIAQRYMKQWLEIYAA